MNHGVKGQQAEMKLWGKFTALFIVSNGATEAQTTFLCLFVERDSRSLEVNHRVPRFEPQNKT